MPLSISHYISVLNQVSMTTFHGCHAGSDSCSFLHHRAIMGLQGLRRKKQNRPHVGKARKSLQSLAESDQQ